jgi:hypothetical protein
MDSSTFDLNIKNYNINDLEKLFSLNANYKGDDIEKNGDLLYNKLLYSANINKKFKKSLLSFISSAKDLLYSYLEPSIPEPSNGRVDNEIITRPETPHIVNYSNNFVNGKINPLKVTTLTRCLLIDTRFRHDCLNTNIQSSDFTINLPTKLKNVVSMQLSSFEFPVTFYGISESYGNNYLYISVNYTLSLTSEIQNVSNVFTITDGNYSVTDLITTINALFAEDLNTIFQYIELSIDLTTNGSGTGKIVIAPSSLITSPDTINSISLDFTRDINGVIDSYTPTTTKIGWNLGFIKKTYTNLTLISDTIPEPSAIRYVYLVIDDFNNHVNDYFISALNPSSIVNKNVLARIPIKSSYFSLMMENDLSLYTIPRHYFGPVDITRLKVQLLDDHGRVLGMNNSNYSICLNFVLLYE